MFVVIACSSLYPIQYCWLCVDLYPMGVVKMTQGSVALEFRYDHTHWISAHDQQYYMPRGKLLVL